MNVKSFIKNTIISLLPQFIISELDNRFYYKHRSSFYFSQEGEDIILQRFLGNMEEGFFVDVGAHHPMRYSNTYKLYLKGWRGINIDATPGSMDAFNKLRPGDTNIELGVSVLEGEMSYYMFDEPALNTFSKERADFVLKKSDAKLEKTVLVKTKPLKQILKENLPLHRAIDLMTIDVEGLDYDILMSNDWNVYRPYILLTEMLYDSFENIRESKAYKFLHPLGYEIIAKTHNTVFFRDVLKK